MAVRKAGAVWEGRLRDGKGHLKTESGVLDHPFSFGTRFEQAKGTNPEELVGAALAGCFSMALSADLERAGTPVTRVETDAAVTVEKVEAGFRVTKIHLVTRGTVPGMAADAFVKAATSTKDNCIISQLYRGNAQITIEASLD
jgi:osmotically inducible protein OsmC